MSGHMATFMSPIRKSEPAKNVDAPPRREGRHGRFDTPKSQRWIHLRSEVNPPLACAVELSSAAAAPSPLRPVLDP
jgi:hypothetical protein